MRFAYAEPQNETSNQKAMPCTVVGSANEKSSGRIISANSLTSIVRKSKKEYDEEEGKGG